MKSDTTGRALSVLALFSCIALTAACGGKSSSPAPSASPVRVVFQGVGSLGIFDPSVAEDPASGRLWMSYSEVSTSSQSRWGVGLRLAFTDDRGQTWQDAGLVVDPQRDVTVGPLNTTPPESAIAANSPGTWQSETSSLLYDAAAPAGERWKLIWHQVLWANNVAYFGSYGWIAMKAAASPAGLASAPAEKLFGGYLLKSDGENTGTPAHSPIGGPALIALDTLHAELNNCVFGEPGWLVQANTLYVALDCHRLGATVESYIVLLRCATPCNVRSAASWTYVRRILTPTDAQVVNSRYRNFSAAALTQVGGQVYLIATPVEPVSGDDRYDGCRVFRFADLANGLLDRNGSGQLITVRQVSGIAGTHHGACAYHANLREGILYSQLVPSDPPTVFRLLQSRVPIP